ncbi:MAG TPA: LPS assembly protein LptD [Gammaproteobacteria bacterium]|nr:LPS assembly protein LptD [Gammaproteobacteria bacterium]MDP7154332.1 LPS assembly protein LptD [Gammaproteobacteria bacterium]MDP7296372.1 LPS assembly protein LptD [Gammaproteobacteria bacterium]HJP37793.1 LPS assembly protein LptD [Gammaproteobacteria bacterium]
MTAEEPATVKVSNGDAPNWGECRVPDPPPFALPDTNLPDDELAVFSGRAELKLDGNASFSDDISLVSGNRLLTAKGASYDRESGVFSVTGEVEFRDPQTRITANRGEFNQHSQELRFDETEFQLWSVPARGKSKYIKTERNGKLRLNTVSYTSCPEGNNGWLLKASKIRIDRSRGIGTAKNARLEFKGVPFLYLPYISYPVTNQRKSGWLIPKIGSSQQRGLDVEFPYYWNIAPQYDATLTPRYMSKRGIQLNTEFRYLKEYGDGVISGEILPNDDVTNQHRALVAWQHTTNFSSNWRGQIDAIHVSDSAYFEELSSGLGNTSQTHLQRRADLEFFNDNWSALLRFEDYQTIDDAITVADLPYTTLPKLAVRGFKPNGWLGLKYTLDTEISYFDHETRETGLRTHIQPEIAAPRQWHSIQIEPAVAFDYTAYQLNDTAPGATDNPSRAVPIYSIDAHTVFERLTTKRGWLQTLEPQLLYTYIPFHDQTDLPVFDTIEPDLNVVQLFRKNRFVGYDRLGDTNQLSMGITTRLIDADDGDEFMNATIGQILYFNSLDVTLPDGLSSDSNSSDYLFEFGLKFHENWRMRLGYQYNTHSKKSKKTELRLNYRASDLKLANVSYRFRGNTLEEIDVSAAWPISEHWRLVGRYDHSILDKKALERFVGFEYDTCCWSIRGIWQRNLTNRAGESDTSFSVQLLLKGLGNNTSAADHWLDRGILDYY